MGCGIIVYKNVDRYIPLTVADPSFYNSLKDGTRKILGEIYWNQGDIPDDQIDLVSHRVCGLVSRLNSGEKIEDFNKSLEAIEI